jgi:hypothetical protein
VEESGLLVGCECDDLLRDEFGTGFAHDVAAVFVVLNQRGCNGRGRKRATESMEGSFLSWSA